MHTTEVKNDSKEAANDGPSVLGRFTWAVVGRTCVPCLLKNDNSRYVSVRIAESEVLGHFLHKLNTEVFNCISVKSFGITEAENKLLNEINSKHCEFAYGKEAFSMNSDFIVKLDDLIEFYNFMDICYNKLLLQNASSNDRNNKCGFVRINEDSVVPYAVKNDQKYVPLFYFEGETESLKSKAINLENWDLAYLKFCCKVQGIKNELFASEKCMVTSLEDVKSYFPEGTKFDDYWPSKIVEMQQPSNRAEMNGNHSWVQTPHIDTSTVVPPQSSVPTNKAIPSALSRQLHTNQRVNSSAVITNLTSNVPIYPNNSWSNTLMGNSPATVSSSTYQLSQQSNQTRGNPKMNSASMHTVMNQNTVTTPRTYVNQSIRSQPSQYYLSHVNVPNASGTSQQPPPLVRVSTANSVSNAYGNTISSDTYSSHIYSNNNQSLPNLLAVPSRHTTNANSQQQQQIKSRGTVSNQVANSTVTRFPPALTPINGTNNVIQVAANSTSLNNVSNNINSIMAVNNRQQQQQYRTNLIQSGGEIIDLSSPPHSPQHMNNAVNRIPSVSNSNYSLKTNSHPNLPPLKRITDAPLMKNGVPQYKVETIKLFNKSIPVINLKPYSDADYAISLQDIITNYFPRVEMNKMRNWLQNVLNINLYEANSAQVQLLRDHCKGKAVSDDLPLLRVLDFESNHARIAYLDERDNGERDAKRQKVS
ncbi:hypothetical protein V9T40_009207 [Parthenolecanium corni]|uniref:Uncharacterized protein n=1 Tax=Parthenolecanium corni TaxID=536013 RepID=A0AAN9TPE9_9HEMI